MLKISIVFFSIFVFLLLMFLFTNSNAVTISNSQTSQGIPFTVSSEKINVNTYVSYNIPKNLSSHVKIISYVKLYNVNNKLIYNYSSNNTHIIESKSINIKPGLYRVSTGVIVIGNHTDVNRVDGIMQSNHSIFYTSIIMKPAYHIAYAAIAFFIAGSALLIAAFKFHKPFIT